MGVLSWLFPTWDIFPHSGAYCGRCARACTGPVISCAIVKAPESVAGCPRFTGDGEMSKEVMVASVPGSAKCKGMQGVHSGQQRCRGLRGACCSAYAKQRASFSRCSGCLLTSTVFPLKGVSGRHRRERCRDQGPPDEHRLLTVQFSSKVGTSCKNPG